MTFTDAAVHAGRANGCLEAPVLQHLHMGRGAESALVIGSHLILAACVPP